MSLDTLTGTPRTAAQLHGLIDKIDTLVLQVLSDDNPDAGASYRVGDRQVSRTEYLRWLLTTRRSYVQELARLPVWETTIVQTPSPR